MVVFMAAEIQNSVSVCVHVCVCVRARARTDSQGNRIQPSRRRRSEGVAGLLREGPGRRGAAGGEGPVVSARREPWSAEGSRRTETPGRGASGHLKNVTSVAEELNLFF